MAQIIIVGAGPTGAALALLLVKAGINVTLIEAAKDLLSETNPINDILA
jgi:2-polyprenyl-6-methoxyphenol hydroxylase-like FAD-dependent oxidoreductase